MRLFFLAIVPVLAAAATPGTSDAQFFKAEAKLQIGQPRGSGCQNGACNTAPRLLPPQYMLPPQQQFIIPPAAYNPQYQIPQYQAPQFNLSPYTIQQPPQFNYSPSVTVGPQTTYSVPKVAEDLHTHTCARGHTWDHRTNPTHVCTFPMRDAQGRIVACGLPQYEQDVVRRPVTQVPVAAAAGVCSCGAAGCGVQKAPTAPPRVYLER